MRLSQHISKNNIHDIFGQTVRFERERKKLTQQELSIASGLHRTYIGSLERGERNPTLTVIKKLADALNVPIAKLVTKIDAVK